jgi:hypothetical protein
VEREGAKHEVLQRSHKITRDRERDLTAKHSGTYLLKSSLHIWNISHPPLPPRENSGDNALRDTSAPSASNEALSLGSTPLSRQGTSHPPRHAIALNERKGFLDHRQNVPRSGFVRKEYPAAIFDAHAWTIHSARAPTTKLTSHRIPGHLTSVASEIRKGVMVSAPSHIEEGDLDYSWLQFAYRAEALIGELNKPRATHINIPLD